MQEDNSKAKAFKILISEHIYDRAREIDRIEWSPPHRSRVKHVVQIAMEIFELIMDTSH